MKVHCGSISLWGHMGHTDAMGDTNAGCWQAGVFPGPKLSIPSFKVHQAAFASLAKRFPWVHVLLNRHSRTWLNSHEKSVHLTLIVPLESSSPPTSELS